jgi:hypothetical protein
MTGVNELRFFNNGANTGDVLDEFRVYTGSLSQNEIDALYLNPAGNGGTKISGDQITTGKIESNNFSAGVGSKFDLTAGTIQLGGSDSPKFSVTNTGEVSASAGQIGGWNIDSQAIYSQSDTQHLYLASDGTKVSSGNYLNKPVIDIANTGASDFRLSMGATLYKQKENQGILLHSDYTSDTRLFEISVQKNASNVNSFTASIAGWDFNHERLAKGNVTMSSADERIKLGTVSDFTNDNSSNKGVLMGKDSSDYEFFVGQEATEYIHWTGTELKIKSTNIDVEVADLHLTASDIMMETDAFFLGTSGSSGQFLSGSGANIEISSSGFHLKPEGDVILSGSITANDGVIGGWQISPGIIHSEVSSDDGMEINTSKGIFARGVASHSIESHGAHFTFAQAHISIQAGGGGQEADSDGEVASQGGGNSQYDDPPSGN